MDEQRKNFRISHLKIVCNGSSIDGEKTACVSYQETASFG